MSISFNDVAVVFVKENDDIFHFWCMSKDENINSLKDADLSAKNGTLENENFDYHILKMNK